jgi:hydroxymethylglutaryl-CoA lyase
VHYPVLVPNVKGLEKAIENDVQEIAVFGAASESFTQKNIRCSIDESLSRFKEVVEVAKEHDIRIRGYVSCVMGCPYEGDIDPKVVSRVTQ